MGHVYTTHEGKENNEEMLIIHNIISINTEKRGYISKHNNAILSTIHGKSELD